MFDRNQELNPYTKELESDRDFMERMESYKYDHEPNGWPAIMMCDLTRLINIVKELKKSNSPRN